MKFAAGTRSLAHSSTLVDGDQRRNHTINHTNKQAMRQG